MKFEKNSRNVTGKNIAISQEFSGREIPTTAKPTSKTPSRMKLKNFVPTLNHILKNSATTMFILLLSFFLIPKKVNTSISPSIFVTKKAQKISSELISSTIGYPVRYFRSYVM